MSPQEIRDTLQGYIEDQEQSINFPNIRVNRYDWIGATDNINPNDIISANETLLPDLQALFETDYADSDKENNVLVLWQIQSQFYNPAEVKTNIMKLVPTVYFEIHPKRDDDDYPSPQTTGDMETYNCFYDFGNNVLFNMSDIQVFIDTYAETSELVTAYYKMRLTYDARIKEKAVKRDGAGESSTASASTSTGTYSFGT